MTLTTKGVWNGQSWVYPEWSTIMSWWSRLIAWARRGLGGLEYACVKEQGSKTGMRHLHAIVLGWTWLSQELLSSAWQTISGAYNVTIRRVRASGIASYVAKYIGKGLGSLPLGKLITYSSGFPKLPGVRWIEYVDMGQGAPNPRAWADVMVDGSLVEWWGPGGPCACFGCHKLLE